MKSSMATRSLRRTLGELAAAKPDFRLVVLTGAGISRESGLATFREAGGLWDRYPIEQVATPEAYLRDPQLVHAFYNLRRREVLSARPNAAHAALARLERSLGGRLALVTQNIDDLHERAGSGRVIHMHGEVRKLRCEGSGHVFEWNDDAGCQTRCPACGAAVRPHVVWFGETPLEMSCIAEALKAADVFCSVGTSGTVYPAAGFAGEVGRHRGLCIEVNPEPTGGPFDLLCIGPASEQVPLLVEILSTLHGRESPTPG